MKCGNYLTEYPKARDPTSCKFNFRHEKNLFTFVIETVFKIEPERGATLFFSFILVLRSLKIFNKLARLKKYE